MEKQHSSQGRPEKHPQLHTIIPPSSNSFPPRTANSTPMSSPGLFSPSNPRPGVTLPIHSGSETNTPSSNPSPFLHPLQKHKVRETHKALIDSDLITGRKLINQYEVIEEIGRGMHGKVKLARNLETGENVAIKIIPRFSKKRRLGKVTAMSQQDKTKKEIAILKKIRHPNVVALLEIIDDPELKKIHMVLEHVELGEIVWRKKGLPHICLYERRRVEREMRGETHHPEEEKYDQIVERRQALKESKRAKMSQAQAGVADYWSLEYGPAEDDSQGSRSRVQSHNDFALLDRGAGSMPSSLAASRATSRAPSRTQSVRSLAASGKVPTPDPETLPLDAAGDLEALAHLRSNPASSSALDGTAYVEDPVAFRARSPSMADSIISHMSSVDFNPQAHDPFVDDYSYVPCFTLDQARSTFRGTVLGLEYLHYQGVVHRDIKPANLLWTKDHRVKISDFGVSYFGRPIRDGEPDDTVSESEARDFDNDLELAKTVGTPAFFAPELCYTDIEKDQPKVSEQIDVWSLGVTLYCLIYARIPFLAEDEFQMFRKIATEDVYIPRRRLLPVDPSTPPNATSLYKRQNSAPYRDDNELLYEDVDNLLYDLLRRMLTKDPEKRIRLRDIKRHPWVVQGIPNLIGWLDDTDPARPSSGRRIQVDERDVSHAVVPLTFLERARSVVKKAVGKVMHPLVERGDSHSRRRATSSAASSSEDIPQNVPSTPQLRDGRRRSLRGEDYFVHANPCGEARPPGSGAGSPTDSPVYDPLATVLATDAHVYDSPVASSDSPLDRFSNRSLPNELTSASFDSTSCHRHSHTRSMGHNFIPHIPGFRHAQTTPTTPSREFCPSETTPSTRETRNVQFLTEDSSRARSVDRGLSNISDKQPRPHPITSAGTHITSPNLHRSKHPRPVRSIDLGKAKAMPSYHSPSPLSPGAAAAYQHMHHNSDPNIRRKRASTELDERPRSVHHIENIPDAKSPPPRVYNTSTPESFARAKEANLRKRRLEFELQTPCQQASSSSNLGAEAASELCPGSPDDEAFPTSFRTATREPTMTTGKSSSSTSVGGTGTPLTSPSELTSPVTSATFHPPKANPDQMQVFQSDPSLPALLSGASSVSADFEGDLLCKPGVVSSGPAFLETTDSLTPPAMEKEPIAGFPLEQALEDSGASDSGVISVHIDAGSSANPGKDPTVISPKSRAEEDEGDSDSDEGLTMPVKKKTNNPSDSPAHKATFAVRRRNTNASIGSTETAKKVTLSGDEVTAQPLT